MDTENYIKLKSKENYTHELNLTSAAHNIHNTDLNSDGKQNFDLIESIMEQEKVLMQQPATAVVVNRTELNIISNSEQQEQQTCCVSPSSSSDKSLYNSSSSSPPPQSGSSKLNLTIDNSVYPYDLEGVSIPGNNFYD